MKIKYTNIIGSSLMGLGLTLASGNFSEINALTLTNDPPCNAAAAVFNPNYDDCKGAYELGNGENDVTDGGSDNIATQLLNVDKVFGDPLWTFLDKLDITNQNTDQTYSGTYFDISTTNQSKSGTISFSSTQITEIEKLFGPSFTNDYELVVSFKAAKNFSLYKWDAPIWTSSPYTIDWVTNGTATNQNGIPQGLSHASVYVRKSDGGGGGGNPSEVPEPGTVAALGMFALGGLRFLRKKR